MIVGATNNESAWCHVSSIRYYLVNIGIFVNVYVSNARTASIVVPLLDGGRGRGLP